MKTAYIYKLFSNDNPEAIRYIGQTVSPMNIRLIQHKSDARRKYHTNRRLLNWIRSVNLDIGIEQIDICSYCTSEEIDNMEIEWIKSLQVEYDLVNTSKGGKSGNGLTGTANPKARRILQYTIEGVFVAEFNMMTEACEKTGINIGKISNCINLKRVKSGGGFIWKGWIEDYPLKIESYSKKKCNYPTKKILQKDMNGNIIREWDGLHETERQLGIFRQGIRLCIRGKTKSYKGYIWEEIIN